jgi:hypothetical protein
MESKIDIYMVAGIDAIGYGEIAIESLFANCKDSFNFTLITDTAEDKRRYSEMLRRFSEIKQIQVMDENDCDKKAEIFYDKYSYIKEFRKGHPCWRKITDPSLFSEIGREIIVLDPDLYFPNPFHFERTQSNKLILMRQHRHCLLPESTVKKAFELGIPMAHHTDIGVAHHTVLPWEWINEIIRDLGGKNLPRVPHIESILWAAIGIHIGGGYLDPKTWQCWERTLLKRLVMMAGVKGPSILKMENISKLKCFHASSGAKVWMLEAKRVGIFKPGSPKLNSTFVAPFVEISEMDYDKGERSKKIYHSFLRSFGLSDPLK